MMRPRTIIFAILLAIVVIILFNNKEEASFWLFGEIRTSKLIILGVFFLLGMIAGGFLFRRKKPQHPKEYGVSNQQYPEMGEGQSTSHLSDSDREFLSRD